MSYLYDPRGRRRPAVQPPSAGGGMPTLEDYAALAQAYRELTARHDAQTRENEARRTELAIRDEALHRQAEDLKKTQSELVWTRAALEQARAEPARETPSVEGDDWKEKYLRLQAEVDNLRRRWEGRFASETAEARRAILRDMLPLADHLEMALEHAEALDMSAGTFVESIRSTLRAFLDTLRRYGVEPQSPLGQPFDPQHHEAVGKAPHAETPQGHVAHVVRSGYMEGDALLRPARVIVSEGADRSGQ